MRITSRERHGQSLVRLGVLILAVGSVVALRRTARAKRCGRRLDRSALGADAFAGIDPDDLAG